MPALNPSQYADLDLQKLDIQTKSDAIRAKASGDTSKIEFQVANTLISARDVGYANALVDVMKAQPSAKAFKDVQEALNAWAAAVKNLVPQFPA